MAVTIEDSTIISTGIYSGMFADFNVGIETGVDVLSISGFIDLHCEFVPVSRRTDGEVGLRQILKHVDGRLVALHQDVDVEVHAGAVQRDVVLVALLALGGVEHVAHCVHGLPLAVLHHDPQHHLGTFIPHSTMLVGILPVHAHGVGLWVFPLRRVVGYAQ